MQCGDGEEAIQITCNFLIGCTGYYRYDEGYSPAFPDAEAFTGTIVHPSIGPRASITRQTRRRDR